MPIDDALTGFVGGLNNDLQKRRDQKLELAMLSRKLELENAAKAIPKDQYASAVNFLQTGDNSQLTQTHPAAQAAVLGGVKPLLGIGAKNQAKRALMDMDDNNALQAVLNNPELFDKLPPEKAFKLMGPLNQMGFNYLGKPLSGEMQSKVISANSGLRAIQRANEKLNADPKTFLSVYVRGIGAKDLQADLNEVMDVVTRARTGAALNKDEQTFYKAQIMSDNISTLIDDLRDGTLDANSVKYRLNTIVKPYLEEMSNVRESRKTATVNRPGAPSQKQAVNPNKQAVLDVLKDLH